MADHLDKNDNGIHRRDFLKSVTMAGTGLALSVTGGTAKYRIATTPLIDGQGYPLVPWLSMRGNRQNTGISPLVGFNFTSNGRTPALYRGDTNKPDSKVLSLINATPIIGVTDGNEVVYVVSSDNHFYAFTVTGTGTLTSTPLKNIVDSAGCFISKEQLYFPTGDFSLYATGTTPPLSNTVEYPMDKAKDPSPSTIDWFEGNVVADVNNLLYAGCDNFYLHCCQPGAENPPLWRFATGFFIWSACAFSPDNSSAYFAGADMTNGVPRPRHCFGSSSPGCPVSVRRRWGPILKTPAVIII